MMLDHKLKDINFGLKVKFCWVLKLDIPYFLKNSNKFTVFNFQIDLFAFF